MHESVGQTQVVEPSPDRWGAPAPEYQSATWNIRNTEPPEDVKMHVSNVSMWRVPPSAFCVHTRTMQANGQARFHAHNNQNSAP